MALCHATITFQTGNLVDVLSSGHRCKQEPSAVAQFPLESRQPIDHESGVYNQFTGIVDVLLCNGTDLEIVSSMETNQPNQCIKSEEVSLPNADKNLSDFPYAKYCSVGSVALWALLAINITFSWGD